jgi:hypothetical protein
MREGGGEEGENKALRSGGGRGKRSLVAKMILGFEPVSYQDMTAFFATTGPLLQLGIF